MKSSTIEKKMVCKNWAWNRLTNKNSYIKESISQNTFNFRMSFSKKIKLKEMYLTKGHKVTLGEPQIDQFAPLPGASLPFTLLHPSPSFARTGDASQQPAPRGAQPETLLWGWAALDRHPRGRGTWLHPGHQVAAGRKAGPGDGRRPGAGKLLSWLEEAAPSSREVSSPSIYSCPSMMGRYQKKPQARHIWIMCWKHYGSLFSPLKTDVRCAFSVSWAGKSKIKTTTTTGSSDQRWPLVKRYPGNSLTLVWTMLLMLSRVNQLKNDSFLN